MLVHRGWIHFLLLGQVVGPHRTVLQVEMKPAQLVTQYIYLVQEIGGPLGGHPPAQVAFAIEQLLFQYVDLVDGRGLTGGGHSMVEIRPLSGSCGPDRWW